MRAPSHPVAAAAVGAVLAVCIYHIIPGGTVADDALRAACAALACAAALACLGRDRRRAERTGVCALALGGLALWATGLLTCGAVGAAGAWAVLAASCLGTAVWEETLFRRLLPDAFATQLGSEPAQRLLCAVVCSALFGLLHLGGGTGVADGAALGASAARFAQTALFGLAMAGVATYRSGLIGAIALHGLYDLAGFAVAAHTAGGIGPGLLAQPAESLLSAFVAPEALAASIALFAPLALWACLRLLRAHQLGTPPGHQPTQGA